MQNFKIFGVGSYVPGQPVKNEDLECVSGSSASWVREKLGIDTRYLSSAQESTSDLACQAIRDIPEFGLGLLSDVDLLIVATATPDKLAPSTASIVAQKLGICSALAFDVSAVCCGFIFALDIADKYFRSGVVKSALVVGADQFSKVTDWHRRDALYFGDGAGAVYLTATLRENSYYSSLLTEGRGNDNFYINHGEQYVMNAHNVFDSASSSVPRLIKRPCKAI